MANSHKLKSVKNDLFKNIDENVIIKLQKTPNSKPSYAFRKPLFSLFGFYDCEYYIINKNNTMNLHLVSSTPFSKDEIRVLQARLQVVYNKDYDKFNIYQEPSMKMPADKWLKERKTFDVQVDDKLEDEPVYRTIGKICSFDADDIDYKLDNYTKESTIDEKVEMSEKDRIINIFHALMVKKAKGQNFATFTITDLDFTPVDNGFKVIAYIKSKDSRVGEFFSDVQMTTELAQSTIKDIRSFEVIDSELLE